MFWRKCQRECAISYALLISSINHRCWCSRSMLIASLQPLTYPIKKQWSILKDANWMSHTLKTEFYSWNNANTQGPGTGSLSWHCIVPRRNYNKIWSFISQTGLVASDTTQECHNSPLLDPSRTHFLHALTSCIIPSYKCCLFEWTIKQIHTHTNTMYGSCKGMQQWLGYYPTVVNYLYQTENRIGLRNWEIHVQYQHTWNSLTHLFSKIWTYYNISKELTKMSRFKMELEIVFFIQTT